MSRRIAFLLLVHNEPEHMRRLLKVLAPFGDCFVHVDAKSDQASFWVDSPHVHFVSDRKNVRWGGVSVVDATLSVMTLALHGQHGRTYDWLILLSGSCFPAKHLSGLLQYLDSHGRKAVMSISDVGGSRHHSRSLAGVWLYEFLPNGIGGAKGVLIRLVRGLLQRVLSPVRRRWRFALTPYIGSQWWAMPTECADHVVREVSRCPELRRFYSFSLAPDEQLIQTVVGNSSYAGEKLRSSDKIADHANLHLISPDLTRWFEMSDLDEIRDSGRWFVRKTRSAGLCAKLAQLSEIDQQ